MIKINADNLAERFMHYVRIDTQSDPQSNSFPTSEKQKELSRLLLNELTGLGLNAELDEFGYVYATIPSNSQKNVPAICFCSHVDTAPDCSGTNVKPVLHKDYDGVDIVLPHDTTQVLRVSESPYLKNHIGSDIITASGLTLLGGDDKSGVAVIMQAAEYLVNTPSVKHGNIKIVFTPDEEVGKGTAKIDIKKIGAKFGYTLDGGDAGSLEDETFSADAAKIIVNGVISHPGYAKGKLVNALKIAGEILSTLPKNEWAPEATEKKEGFVHPVRVEGIAEKSTIEFIVRDFNTNKLKEYEERLKQIAQNFPGDLQCINKFTLRITGVRYHSIYNDLCSICTECFILEASCITAIKGVAEFCPKLFYINLCRSLTNFFIGSKYYFDIAMLY